jgi:hypothetical protein
MDRPLGERFALLTDLYQLTMAACYFEEGMAEQNVGCVPRTIPLI